MDQRRYRAVKERQVALRLLPSPRLQLLRHSLHRSMDAPAGAYLRGGQSRHRLLRPRAQLPAQLPDDIRAQEAGRRHMERSEGRSSRKLDSRPEVRRWHLSQTGRRDLHRQRRRWRAPLQSGTARQPRNPATVHRQVHCPGKLHEHHRYQRQHLPHETSQRERRRSR